MDKGRGVDDDRGRRRGSTLDTVDDDDARDRRLTGESGAGRDYSRGVMGRTDDIKPVRQVVPE